MFLEKSVIGQLTYDPITKSISVRRDDQIYKNQILISSIPHRHVVALGDDLTMQAPEVVKLATAMWAEEA
jgi:hypothetical protein